MYILIMRSKYILCFHMDFYGVTFYLGLRIGIIGPVFDISIIIYVLYSLLQISIESRNSFDCTYFFY